MTSFKSPRQARLNVESKVSARAHILSSCFVPKLAQVLALEPDEAGALRYVSRQEAIDRHLEVYTGRLSALDKPFQLRGAPNHQGGWGSIRYTANGLTAGQLKVQKSLATTQEESA